MQYHDDKQKRIFYAPRKKEMPTNKSKGLLLSKAFEGFTLSCKARKLSEHTISDYAHTFKIFLAHIGGVDIATIQPAQVTAFLAAQDEVSAKTVLNYHVGLSSLWTWALKNDYVASHIMRKVDAPDPKKTVIHPFPEIEVRALFNGIRLKPERDRAILLVLLDTGLRASELCGLERKDINLPAKQLKVLGKGDKERILPFSNRTATALFKHLALIPAEEKPFNLTRTSLGHHIADIGERVGVEAHPHRFRHTFAVNFLRNGGDPYTLQEMLGHSTMEMVRVYLEISQVDIDGAHKRASPVEHWQL